MKVKHATGFRLLNMLLSEGSPDILETLASGTPKQFNDLYKLLNPRTGRKYSPNTLSSRLKELSQIGAIKQTIVQIGGRPRIAYGITAQGQKALAISKKFESELESIFGKSRQLAKISSSRN